MLVLIVVDIFFGKFFLIFMKWMYYDYFNIYWLWEVIGNLDMMNNLYYVIKNLFY